MAAEQLIYESESHTGDEIGKRIRERSQRALRADPDRDEVTRLVAGAHELLAQLPPAA